MFGYVIGSAVLLIIASVSGAGISAITFNVVGILYSARKKYD